MPPSRVRSGRGRQPFLLGLALLWGQQRWSGGEGGARLVGCSGSSVGDGGKETEGEKGSGSPWSREPLEKGDQTGNVVLPTTVGRRDCWRQGKEPGRRVLRCARREMGAGL